MSALRIRMGRWAPTRQGTLLVLALLYGGWMWLWIGLSLLFLFLLYFAVAVLEIGIGLGLGLAFIAIWLAPPLAAYGAARLERMSATGARLRYGLGGRWGKACVLAVLAAALLMALAMTYIGFATAVMTATMSMVLLLISAVTPRHAGWAFAVLTIFVLSIGAFNVLPLTFSGLTLPAHALVFAPFLWLQRGTLRSDPARLRRLVWLGVGLCAALLAVHGAVLWAELAGLGLEAWLNNAFPPELQLERDRPPADYALYLGYPLPFTVLFAGVLLLLLDRFPKAVSAPITALGVAGVIAWPFAAPMLLSVSGLEWAEFLFIGRGAWIAD